MKEKGTKAKKPTPIRGIEDLRAVLNAPTNPPAPVTVARVWYDVGTGELVAVQEAIHA